MGKKKAKNKRNSELKIIFFIILVAAALFIVSTYAWFSTQRDVSITNLQGTVEVAEGLEISLDAENWSNDIVLGDGEGKLSIIDDAYTNHRNISPVEMLPVSTLGSKVAGTMDAAKDITMIRGKITNSIILSDIVAMNESLALNPDKTTHNSEDEQYPGYFAFDVFLKNSSKNEADADTLQLNYNSSVQITETENANTGLQNTVRVAFARYGATTKDGNGVAGLQDSVTDILKLTGATSNNINITDVAIWEPNSGTHVEYIVTNNNKIKWSSSDGSKYGTYSEETGLYEFGQNTQMPTYALSGGALSLGENGTISNIYDWSGTNSSTMSKQVVLQTTNSVDAEGNVDYKINEGVQNLKSVTSTDSKAVDFVIAPNSIVRMRVYVWLEGQDVDCINWASYGGGVTVNIGLVKGSTIGSKGEAQAD